MRPLLAWCVLLMAGPALGSALDFEAVVQPPPTTFNIRKADIYAPVSVVAVSLDGKCRVNLELARMDPDPDSPDDSLSGRVASALCSGRTLDSGFATGSYRRTSGDYAVVNSKIEIVLVVDE